MDVATPQGQHPVVNLDGGGDGNNQRGGGKEKAEIRVHTADVHVVRPHYKTERSDTNNRPYHHSIAEDVLPCMGADQIRDDAKGWQGDNIDLGMPEEPEQ